MIKATILPLASLVELAKRPLFMALYPIAHLRRDKCRAEDAAWYDRILWLALDDSIVKDSLDRCGEPLEYCSYGKRLPLIEKMKDGKLKEFLRAYYWGALRNNSINLMNETEKKIGEQVGAVNRKEFKGGYYEDRKYSSGLTLPYFEWYPKGGFRVQVGFTSSGRFQQQAREYPCRA